MTRQSSTPVSFNKSTRIDSKDRMITGFAGKVQLVDQHMLLPGDSASGSVKVHLKLAEQPRPLLNKVQMNVQAWFVERSIMPQFAGLDEFQAAWTDTVIKAMGQADRGAPDLFNSPAFAAGWSKVRNSVFAKGLGKHFPDGWKLNTEALDAFWLVYNFRLAAHSDRMLRRPYSSEDIDASLIYPPAFWPSSRITRMVPDYDRDLVMGSMDLDVAAGQLPIEGITRTGGNITNADARYSGDNVAAYVGDGTGLGIKFDFENTASRIYAEMEGQRVRSTLADLDIARMTKTFGKMHETMAGNDPSGYGSEDMLQAMLMQGLSVPADQFRRPWSLSSQRVNFVQTERFATDAGNLDQSVSEGEAMVTLPINVPRSESGGQIIVTVEVLPERIDERAMDHTWTITERAQMPDALRDVQRSEPVDAVSNYRIDARHSVDSQYAWEPMNDVWNMEGVELGGDFFQPTPGTINDQQRQALWIPNIVDPVYSESHFLCPENFPQDVFAFPEESCFEGVVSPSLTIVGLTQIGDPLAEDNGSFEYVYRARESYVPE